MNISMNDLYNNYNEDVIKMAAKYSKALPHMETEDIAQEAWIVIMKKFHLFDEDKVKATTEVAAIRAWLYMLVKSATYKLIRAANTDKRKILYNTIPFEWAGEIDDKGKKVEDGRTPIPIEHYEDWHNDF